MKFSFVLCFAFFVSVHTLFAQQFEYFNGHKAQSGQVVYKIKAQSALKSAFVEPDGEQIQFSSLLSVANARSEIMFPQIKKPDANCRNCVDLTRVYRLTYDPQKISLTRIISLLRRLSFIEYAEPLYVDEFLSVPNDTYVVSNAQWFMETMRLFEAWDLPNGQGSENVIIGIVDSGTEILHEDLINKIAVNAAEILNGIDDDDDGYVDNRYGWDFGMDDCDPNPDGIVHGTCVAGLAAAEVNNEKGIAGTGFRCRYLPIKIADKAGNLVRSYEGVIYAALHGCDIINCSWGGVGNHSEFAREVVQFATFNCNALVVAAAGNSGNTGIFYPASYPFALSVAGSVKGDLKWTGSNYNYFVDVCSPTMDYMTTSTGNKYINPGGGTSFSAPIVSGVAGLIKAKFPHYTAMQVGEQLRVNADDIYSIGNNANYRYQLGAGRVNALNALSNTSKPSIRIDSFAMRNTNAHKYTFERGDTVEVDLFCTNYLAALPNMVTLTLDGGSYFTRLNSVTVTSMEMLETKKFTFKLRINQTFSTGSGYYFKLTASSNLYNDYEYITLWFNPLNYDFSFGNFDATATSNGTIGVYDALMPSGKGLSYRKQPSMIYDAGLLLALNDSTTAAQIRHNSDYTTAQNPQILFADSVDLLIESKFKAVQFGLAIDQYIYGWKGVDALIHEYRLTNTSSATHENIRAGIFADWIIGFQNYNMVNYIDSLQCSVISGVDKGGFLVGVMPLHYHKSGVFAYDASVEIDESLASDYFDSQGIWKLLTSTKTTAGIGFDKGGIGNVNTSSWCMIGSIEPNKTDTVRYAIIGGSTLNEICNTASLLKQRYITDTTPPVCDTCPCDTCCEDCSATHNIKHSNWLQLFQNQQYIEFHSNTHTQAYLRINSISGAVVEERFHDFAHGAARFATDNLPKGVYIVTAHNKNEFQTFTIVITN